MISAVPSASYKVPTGWLKDGCVCVNVASEKNFEKDVREKVSFFLKKKNVIVFMPLWSILFFALCVLFCCYLLYPLSLLLTFRHRYTSQLLGR